jgi:hypothetical protein
MNESLLSAPKRVVPTFWEMSSLILGGFTRSATALGAAAVVFELFSKVGLLNFFFYFLKCGNFSNELIDMTQFNEC